LIGAGPSQSVLLCSFNLSAGIKPSPFTRLPAITILAFNYYSASFRHRYGTLRHLAYRHETGLSPFGDTPTLPLLGI
jgi:hypothetical protein